MCPWLLWVTTTWVIKSRPNMCFLLVLVAIYVPMAAVGYYNLGHQVKTNIVDSVCNGTVGSNGTFFAQQFTGELINLLLHCKKG